MWTFIWIALVALPPIFTPAARRAHRRRYTYIEFSPIAPWVPSIVIGGLLGAACIIASGVTTNFNVSARSDAVIAAAEADNDRSET